MMQLSWRYTKKRFLLASGVFIGGIFVILVTGYFLFFEVVYANRVFPGVYVENVSVGGMTYQELLQQLTRFGQKLEQGFSFTFSDLQGQQQRVTVPPEVVGYDNPISDQPFFLFDANVLADRVFNVGRSEDAFLNIGARLAMLFSSKMALPVSLEFQHELYEDLIDLHLAVFERPPRDAQLVLSLGDDGEIKKLVVVPERPGYTFRLDDLRSRMKRAFSRLETGDVSVQLTATSPRITEKNTHSLVADTSIIQEILDQAPVTLLVPENNEEDEAWYITKEYLAQLLEFQYNKESDAVIFGLNTKRLLSVLEVIANTVNIAPQEPIFQMKDGKVEAFSPGSAARELDVAVALTLIEDAILNKHEKNVLLPVQETAPQTTLGSLNLLGIQELAGSATTNFAGSPKNRRHNIQVGSTALNGILIAPGEEFSLVEALGEIDGEAGYLQELVIKGNRTVPEYGGGLCQIATTLFRSVMNAGLPIVERKNHAYTVSYYFENGIPGTDATIYPPHPDMKFVNNTKATLLLQSYTEGDEVTFEFWGTKDGRIAQRTTPVMSKRISAPPTRYVETTDIPPGEEKCTEKPHDGISTKFEYVVTYTDGTVKTQVFESTYRPWQAVCLLGVEASSVQNGTGEASEEPSLQEEKVLPP